MKKLTMIFETGTMLSTSLASATRVASGINAELDRSHVYSLFNTKKLLEGFSCGIKTLKAVHTSDQG